MKKWIKFLIFLAVAGSVITGTVFYDWQKERQARKNPSPLKENTLTFIEGWTLRDYGYYLENKGLFQAEELHEAVGFPAVDYRQSKDLPQLTDWSDKFDFLKDKPKYVSLEGYLFPDTYRVYEDATIKDIVTKMLENFDKKLTPEMREEIIKRKKTIFQVVTVASLVEAEACAEADRYLVADIIWRRLAISMPLQLDSTINYATGEKKAAVSLAEQALNSPYNTYRYPGLPLGPIDNPSLAALQAAVYPEKNSYWYFLTGTDGKMHYGKNLDEHNRNKYRYLK